jgi:hypothetical protein
MHYIGFRKRSQEFLPEISKYFWIILDNPTGVLLENVGARFDAYKKRGHGAK